MDHKTLEAKATITDVGEFTAIAAAYSVDRTNERIVPGAFKGTIAAWQASGKKIPLHWDHGGSAADIIGSVDPASMKEVDDGLEVKGNLDLKDSEVARDAWRSMKAERVGLSFGYLVTEDSTGSDGVRELKALDVFEITVTPAPANPDTRFLSLKTVGGVHFPADEIDGAKAGELKAVWTAAYVNDLPDSAFLYVESGDKDADGKTTPRSKRHFPYKDASGAVDLPHLRNALARIPQSSLSQDVKDRLTSKAQAILDQQKSVTDKVEDRKEEEVTATQLPRQDPVNAKLRTEVLKARASAVNP